MKAKTFSVILSLAAHLAISIFLGTSSFAAPQGPGKINRGTPDHRSGAGTDNETGGAIVQTQSGNMTSLGINSTKITLRWQGFYGNVTGTITLDDASNNTLYNWQLASPQGEIYASNGSTSGAR